MTYSTPDRVVLKVQVAAGAAPVTLAKVEGGIGWIDYPVTVWSPAGDWIAYPDEDGIRLVSPDGKLNRLLTPRRLVAFGFTRDGRRLYGIVSNSQADRRWELVEVEVATGRDRSVGPLQLPDGTNSVAGFSMHPDGTHF